MLMRLTRIFLTNTARDSVAYTGTHDNNTTVGWYQEVDEGTQQHIASYLGRDDVSMPWTLNRLALQSVAALAVLPMQDILSLDGSHRMNVPGTTEGNWSWQFSWEMLTDDSQAQLLNLNKLYGRC